MAAISKRSMPFCPLTNSTMVLLPKTSVLNFVKLIKAFSCYHGHKLTNENLFRCTEENEYCLLIQQSHRMRHIVYLYNIRQHFTDVYDMHYPSPLTTTLQPHLSKPQGPLRSTNWPVLQLCYKNTTNQLFHPVIRFNDKGSFTT